MNQRKTIKEIGYVNILVVCSDSIAGFYMYGLGMNGQTYAQELALKRGQNVIQIGEEIVDEVIYELRKYADEKIVSIKLIDFKGNEKGVK